VGQKRGLQHKVSSQEVTPTTNQSASSSETCIFNQLFPAAWATWEKEYVPTSPLTIFKEEKDVQGTTLSAIIH